MNQFSGAHSDFQVENFIVKGQGHPFFAYKQACREIEARISSAQQNDWNMSEGVKGELEKLIEIADELNKQIRWDDLSEQQRQLLEAQAWFEKAKTLIAVDMLCSGGRMVSKNTMEFILQLPQKQRKELIRGLDNGGQYFIEYVLNK